MGFIENVVVAAQAAWASKTIKVAPEPPGDRFGVVGAGAGPPLTLAAVGDSLVAGSGTDHQSQALTALLAQRLYERTGRPVAWQTHAQLGATLRRVRYRFLPEVPGQVDVLMVCAGSNDVMARRSTAEWAADLEGALDVAQTKAAQVVVLSAGQLHNSPALPKTLKSAIGRGIASQTRASQDICARRGVPYLDVTTVSVPAGFWASDGFHSGPVGYEFAAGLVADLLYPRSSTR